MSDAQDAVSEAHFWGGEPTNTDGIDSKAKPVQRVDAPDDPHVGETFASAPQRFVSVKGPDSRVNLSASVRLLRPPGGHHDEQVWWEVRDFVYIIPWSPKSDYLDRWLRRTAHLANMQAYFDVFEVEAADSFRKSVRTKQEQPTDGNPDRDADVEAMANTEWLLVLMLVVASSNKPPHQQSGMAHRGIGGGHIA